MNSKKTLSIILITVLTLSIAIPFISVNAILGTPDVDPSTVNVGDEVEVSGGVGEVTSGSQVKVYWDYATGPNAHLIGSGYADPDGSYEIDVDIPATNNGTHWIWVEDVATGARERSGDITVNPKIEIDPKSGLSGDPVEITGSGYHTEVDVVIGFYNFSTAPYAIDMRWPPVETVETDEYGSFAVTVNVPDDLYYGTNYLFNATYGPLYDETNFTVGASITVTPTAGPEGSIVEISGRGFTEDATLSEGNITFDGWGGVQIVGNTIDIDEHGEFTGEIIIPSYGEADDWVIGVDDWIESATITFEIDDVSSVSVDPTYGSPGATITVTGENFVQISGTTVKLFLDTTSVGTVDTDASGSFTTTFTVPAKYFRQYTLHANDETNYVNASDDLR